MKNVSDMKEWLTRLIAGGVLLFAFTPFGRAQNADLDLINANITSGRVSIDNDGFLRWDRNESRGQFSQMTSMTIKLSNVGNVRVLKGAVALDCATPEPCSRTVITTSITGRVAPQNDVRDWSFLSLLVTGNEQQVAEAAKRLVGSAAR